MAGRKRREKISIEDAIKFWPSRRDAIQRLIRSYREEKGLLTASHLEIALRLAEREYRRLRAQEKKRRLLKKSKLYKQSARRSFI
jgi:hypothetical protein